MVGSCRAFHVFYQCLHCCQILHHYHLLTNSKLQVHQVLIIFQETETWLLHIIPNAMVKIMNKDTQYASSFTLIYIYMWWSESCLLVHKLSTRTWHLAAWDWESKETSLIVWTTWRSFSCRRRGRVQGRRRGLGRWQSRSVSSRRRRQGTAATAAARRAEGACGLDPGSVFPFFFTVRVGFVFFLRGG